jgi:ABC-type glycerol-3-phosphate transport system substrate-binding protein
MKTLFAILLAILVAAAIYTERSLPDAQTAVPVLYWVTDANPARTEQIRTFRQWLKRNGHPDIELRVDTVNSAPEKVVVQGVSGVCADLVDHSGGGSMRFRQAVGIIEDITDDAKRLGFDVSKTYPVMEPELTVNGRQFAFPCNVTCDLLWVNREVFTKVGMDPPPRRWTLEEFERCGKELVAKANDPGKLQRVFFISDVNVDGLARSMGSSTFNETQTACVISNEAYRKAMALRYTWTYKDHLIPTASEQGSFSTMAGYGGSGWALFGRGNYAMVAGGRYLLIQFRTFSDERREEGKPPMSLSVSEYPHGGMPYSPAFTRATAVYAAGPRKDLSKLFMAFLASEDYNMNIVNDADSLPPNPAFTRIPEFLRPADYPEEWGCHEAFAESMGTIAVPAEFSPFVLDVVVETIQKEESDKYMNDKLTLDETLAQMQARINDEIARSLVEDAAKRPLHAQGVARQKEIDALRAANQPVPLSWITNPYLRRWYQFKGWADEAR